MKAIVAMDDACGLLFNNRRQSRDRVLIEDICEFIGKERLYITSYSVDLFNLKKYNNIVLCDDFKNVAGLDDYVFFESEEINVLANRATELILYRWNRLYPGDTFFKVDLSEWKLVESRDFKGYSHDRITKERYRRKEI